MTPQWEYLVPWTFLCPVSLSVPFLCYAPVLTDCLGRLRDLGGYTENQIAERSKKAQSPSKFSASNVASSLSAAILRFPQISFCYTDTAVPLVAPHIDHQLQFQLSFGCPNIMLACSENISVYLLCTPVLYFSLVRRYLFIHAGLLQQLLHIRIDHLFSWASLTSKTVSHSILPSRSLNKTKSLKHP